MWASIQSWISDSCAFPVFICIMRYLHTYCMTSYRAFCHVTASDLLVQELFSLNGTGPLCSVGVSYERKSVCVCVCGVSLQISTQGERRSGSHSVKMLFLKYTNSHIKNTDDLLIHGCGPYLKDCILVIVRCL